MCLLVTGKSSAVRAAFLNTPGMVEDVYKHNSDGLGVMYATKSGLKVCKTLPKNAHAAREFIAKLPTDDREVAVHWRMRTHGDINLDNCHPYMVTTGVALMHNGILHTGNDLDTKKSDTWHFIEDYLKGVHTDTLHDGGFQRMLGEFIDANRFAIMSADGRLSVVNRDQGVEAVGVWFSNTYAWSPEMLIPTYKVRAPVSYKAFGYSDYADTYKHSTKPYQRDSMDDLTDREWWAGTKQAMAVQPDAGYYLDAELDAAILDCDAETVADMAEEDQEGVVGYVLDNFDIAPYERAADSELTEFSVLMRNALVAGDKAEIMGWFKVDHKGYIPSVFAETLMWYCNLTALNTTVTN